MSEIISWLNEFAITFLHTITDVLPIATIIFGFQVFIIRKRIHNLKRVLIGFFYVILGLALFLHGLEDALFPVGKMMAAQLTDLDFIRASLSAPLSIGAETLGIGLAANVPGRSELLDGFGLIAFASLFPIISVLAYAQLSEWYSKREQLTE